MKKLKGRLQLTGTAEATADSEDPAHIELREVTILANAKLLRKIGKWFLETADVLDKWDHHHFSDFVGDTDFVILSPQHMAQYEADRQFILEQQDKGE